MRVCKSPIGGVLALLGIWISLTAVGAATQQQDGHTFDFRDAELREVIEAVGSMTGKNFLIDDTVKGKVTLIINTPIPADLAYEMLESILQAEGYALVPSVGGNIIRVVPSSKAPTSSIPVGTGGGQPTPGYQYLTEFRWYSVDAEISGHTSPPMVRNNATGGNQQTSQFFTSAEMEWDDVELRMEGETLEWDGQPAPPKRQDISNVANPTVLTLPGKNAVIEIGQEIPYFEPVDSPDSPTSAYKIVHKFVGMRIELALQPAGEGFVTAYLKVEQSEAQFRKKLDGVALDVGAPVIDARSFQTHVTFALDSWVAFQHPDLGGGSLFVFMKVGKILSDAEG